MKNAGFSHQQESLTTKYIKIFIVVSLYWICSIGLVFLNKYLLSSESLKFSAPLFVTWYQCVVAVVLCYACHYLAKLSPSKFTFSSITFDHRISREVLPLSLLFVAMISMNNLCLRYVGVSFYYIGRYYGVGYNSFDLPNASVESGLEEITSGCSWQIKAVMVSVASPGVSFLMAKGSAGSDLRIQYKGICSYLILGQVTSMKAILCCAVIVGGFLLGVDQEDSAGTLSIAGVFFGVTASLCVALNAIYTQRTLPSVGDSIARLTFEVLYFPQILSFRFWVLMTISGVFGFFMSYVTGWQIQVTSPLTHNISGTAKAATQTVIAVMWWQEIKPLLWWISNIVVLGGSATYTMVRRKEMADKCGSNKFKSTDSSERQSLLVAPNDDKEAV